MAELSMFSPDGINSYNYKDAAARNMITPVFTPQTVYAVGDYCIYNNGLYKCTTAHTGAWSENDFVSVSVMDEIKNASGGGGGLPETTKVVMFDRQIDDFTQPYIVKSVTFPVLGDSGFGELSVSGVAQYGSSTNNLNFVGTVQMYKQYNEPYTKYVLVDCDASQSGSRTIISPCFGCETHAYGNSITAFYKDSRNAYYRYISFELDSENLGVVNVALLRTDIDTYELNRVSAVITAIIA